MNIAGTGKPLEYQRQDPTAIGVDYKIQYLGCMHLAVRLQVLQEVEEALLSELQ